MVKYLSRVLLGLVAVWALSGCESVQNLTRGGEPAEVVEAGEVVEGTATDQQQNEGAVAHGISDDERFSASALNDPDSPLSQRIVYFEYDSSEVRADVRPVVEAHATYLSRNADAVVTLEGHADERGSREYNLALGERRAVALRRQMVLMGASAGQIKTTSFGEENPAAVGHDEQSYSLNRRVELVY